MKRVKALKTVLYKRNVYEEGTAFDIDDVSYYTWKNYGFIEDVNVIGNENVNEGLPALDEVPARKKK